MEKCPLCNNKEYICEAPKCGRFDKNIKRDIDEFSKYILNRKQGDVIQSIQYTSPIEENF